jgi:uncharacterized membrane protein YozB (DUF420 family)
MAARDIVAAPRTSLVAATFFLLAAVAFWPAYFAKLPGADELYVDLHAVGVVAWMALLIAQPILIWRRRRPLHRKLGLAAYVVAPFVVGTSVLLMHSRLDPVSAPTFRVDATDSYLALVAVALFAICASLALVFRKNAALHARFMTATLLTMVDPISFRMLLFYSGLEMNPTLFVIIGYGLAELILLGLVIADRKRPLRSQGFLMLAPVFVAGHLGYFTLAQTDAWIAFAAAFKGLPIG